METIARYLAKGLSEKEKSPGSDRFWQALTLSVSYRVDRRISKVMRFPGGYSSYVCPRCSVTLDKEFQAFCDRCGQKLNWNGCRKAAVVFPGSLKVR